MPSNGKDDGKAAAALVAAEEVQERSIRDRMQTHVEGAVQSLGNLAIGKPARRGQKPPSSMVTLTAAGKVLEYAGGKPETREHNTGDSGVTIVIQQFGEEAQKVVRQVIESNQKTLPSGAKMRDQTADVILERAEQGPSSVVHSYEVPD